MPETFDRNRRLLLAATLMSVVARQASNAAAADAVSPQSALGPVKQVNAGLLSVGYVDTGPAGGPPVLLLHGWPYDIYSFVDVAPALA